MFDKKEYIKRQIAKTNKKDYENYVVTRIIHLIDDLEIKFVTQQYVKRPGGKRALADLYFPQIHYFVEVDEMQHLSNEDADKKRDADFVSMVGKEPERIDVATTSIEEIHNRIDQVVAEIKALIQKERDNNTFEPWDPAKEMNPLTWIEKGHVSVKDNVAFRITVDACKAFGLDYLGFQQAQAKHPHEENTGIWFPKLYDNKEWANSFDETTGVIRSSCKKGGEQQKNHVENRLSDPIKRRLIFARVKDNLGDVKYRFRGVFELDIENTNYENGVVWNRVSEVAKTYDYRSSN